MPQDNSSDTTFQVFRAVEGCRTVWLFRKETCITRFVKEILTPIFIPLWICRGRILASVPGTLETLRWNLIIFHFPCDTMDGKSMFLPWKDWPDASSGTPGDMSTMGSRWGPGSWLSGASGGSKVSSQQGFFAEQLELELRASFNLYWITEMIHDDILQRGILQVFDAVRWCSAACNVLLWYMWIYPCRF